MVIQEESEMPLEQSSRKNVEGKVTRNELLKTEHLENELLRNFKHKSKKIKRKHRSNSEEFVPERSSCDKNSENISKISKTDLEELRLVYKKCKAILKKIESKYGHLLDIDSPGPSDELVSSENEEKCTCAMNKKIVFGDDGTEVAQEPDVISHICPKKLNIKHNSTENTLEIEYDGPDNLPEDLPSLSNILQDPDLETTTRNKVISKIRLIKQELMNEVKFNKHAIIEKIKSNPEEVIDFQGANLSSLPGYAV